MMTGRELETSIAAFAKKYRLPFDLCACLVYQESKGNLGAARFEEKWFAAKMLILPTSRLAGHVPRSGTPSIYDEKIWRAHSWGLTQIMGDRARILGFNDDFLPRLQADPELNLDLGIRYLKECIDKTGPTSMFALNTAASITKFSQTSPEFLRVWAGLLRYNGGGDKLYPQKVLNWLNGEQYRRMFW